MSDVQNRVPLPDADPAKIAYIHSLMREQGLPIPIPSAVPAMPAAPESPEQKIGRLFTERGYPKGMPNQPSCHSPLDIAAREQIAREVYSEYQPTNTGTDTTQVTLPQPTTETEAREVLRSAIVKLQEAEGAVSEAVGLVDSTRLRLDQMNTQLAEYNTLDNEITEHTVRDMRQGEVTELPYTLESALRSRASLRDRIDQYSKAFVRLQSELREYETKETQAKLACSTAALAVMNISVETLATELEEHECIRQQLRTQLLSFAHLWVPGSTQGPKPVRLSARVVGVIHRPPVVVDEADAETVSHWKDVLEALQRDPDYILK